jgi:adenylate cyclase, class 2
MNIIQTGSGKEYEAKFLDIDVDKTRKLIKKLGGKLVHKRKKYIRSVFNRCDSKIKGFARVRKEGKKTTMTVKIFNNKKFPDEFEVTIKEGYEEGRYFMHALGLNETAYQENYREKWIFPNIKNVHEVVFDELPGLPIYLEVDCLNEKCLKNMISKLKLDKYKKRFGSFDNTYQEYYGISTDIINNKTKSLSFYNIKNEINPKKNKKLFEKIIKKQQKYKK